MWGYQVRDRQGCCNGAMKEQRRWRYEIMKQKKGYVPYKEASVVEDPLSFLEYYRIALKEKKEFSS